MAFEKTVLNDSIVSLFLSQYYGINFVSMEKLELGSANCFRVYDGDQYYFLKEFQSTFSEDNIVQEAKLLEYLSTSGIPVASFYKTFQNSYVIYYQGHVICLKKYIKGEAYGYNACPGICSRRLGRCLESCIVS